MRSLEKTPVHAATKKRQEFTPDAFEYLSTHKFHHSLAVMMVMPAVMMMAVIIRAMTRLRS